jgi:hypothetical protein
VADWRSGKERGAMCIVIHERRETPPDRQSARPQGVARARRARNAFHATWAELP